MSSILASPVLALEPSILEFAQAQGVASYLLPVLEMTERVFPQALRTQLLIEDDPEIPTDAHIVVQVKLPSVDAEQYVQGKFRWGSELFHICPAPLVCVFRCRLTTVEP
jgi:hypothetical protein